MLKYNILVLTFLFYNTGNKQELAKVLKYHIGGELLVSGGVGSHNRVKTLQGDKLDLGMVGKQLLILAAQADNRNCHYRIDKTDVSALNV